MEKYILTTFFATLLSPAKKAIERSENHGNTVSEGFFWLLWNNCKQLDFNFLFFFLIYCLLVRKSVSAFEASTQRHQWDQ